MKILPIASILTALIHSSNAFLATKPPPRLIQSSLAGEAFDYEYVPPNQDEVPPFDSDLSSSFPPGTPAGLRGEAIRSALRSGRCVGWKLQGRGVVRVEGEGTVDFLNGKLSQTIGSEGYFEACILTPKGWMIDEIGIAMVNSELAFLIPSPRHSPQSLYQLLDKYVFPLDKVEITSMEASSDMFTLASVSVQDIQKCFTKLIVPELSLEGKAADLKPLAGRNACSRVSLSTTSESSLLIIPSSGLNVSAGPGYTFIFLEATSCCDDVWNYLISEECEEGPVEAGALEHDTLRIESGTPGYGMEMNCDNYRVTPVSLHLNVDAEKGCYMGQEGVASVLKNPRGAPRTLYHVIFDDDLNVYNYQSEGEFVAKRTDKVENLTRLPQVGDSLYVLGSNEGIAVGTITSVAEPSSTGDKNIVTLALIRRADSIRRQMADIGIAMPVRPLGEKGEVLPPPFDTLDGVEVIIGGTFTVGRLAMLPGRANKRLYADDVPHFVDDFLKNSDIPDAVVLSHPVKKTSNKDIEQQLVKARAEAEAAAAEAERKKQKMEMLQKRAEQAIARRNSKSNGP